MLFRRFFFRRALLVIEERQEYAYISSNTGLAIIFYRKYYIIFQSFIECKNARRIKLLARS